MIRRTFLGHGLMLFGFSRRARGPQRGPHARQPRVGPERGCRVGVGVWAQLASASVRYSPLLAPVRIPLDGLTTPWHPVSFTAETVLPSAAAVPGQRVRLDGMVFRKSTGDDSPERFSALCMICPHESCLVKFFNDPNLASELSDGAATGPIFSCGCHRSVFDAVEGARLTGPTHRGLYRFRVTDVSDGAVVINEVEEELLLA